MKKMDIIMDYEKDIIISLFILTKYVSSSFTYFYTTKEKFNRTSYKHDIYKVGANNKLIMHVFLMNYV